MIENCGEEDCSGEGVRCVGIYLIVRCIWVGLVEGFFFMVFLGLVGCFRG